VTPTLGGVRRVYSEESRSNCRGGGRGAPAQSLRDSTDVAGGRRGQLLRELSEEPITDAEPHTRVHRALADERRARILEELRGSPDGLDVRQLAERVDLHPNTVRWHLAILADAELVSSRVGERATPGRPRIVYTLGRGSAEGESYRLLATIFHNALGRLENASALAVDAGRAWGRYLVRRPPSNAPPDRDAVVGEVVGLLAQHGFRPEPDGDEIRMHRCPFRELAELEPRTVCAVHRGLLEGALDELGSDLEIEELQSFVGPELCVARFRHTA
jgi:predicted ArsR family transcriptional regulator